MRNKEMIIREIKPAVQASLLLCLLVALVWVVCSANREQLSDLVLIEAILIASQIICFTLFCLYVVFGSLIKRKKRVKTNLTRDYLKSEYSRKRKIETIRLLREIKKRIKKDIDKGLIYMTSTDDSFAIASRYFRSHHKDLQITIEDLKLPSGIFGILSNHHTLEIKWK